MVSYQPVMAASTLAVHVDEDVGDSESAVVFGCGRIARMIFDVEVFGVVDKVKDGDGAVVKVDGALTGSASRRCFGDDVVGTSNTFSTAMLLEVVDGDVEVKFGTSVELTADSVALEDVAGIIRVENLLLTSSSACSVEDVGGIIGVSSASTGSTLTSGVMLLRTSSSACTLEDVGGIIGVSSAPTGSSLTSGVMLLRTSSSACAIEDVGGIMGVASTLTGSTLTSGAGSSAEGRGGVATVACGAEGRGGVVTASCGSTFTTTRSFPASRRVLDDGGRTVETTSIVFGAVSPLVSTLISFSSASTVDDVGGIIVDECASTGVAAASTGDRASAGTLAGKRRLNGSAFAGGQGAFRLASGEGVVVVVVERGGTVGKFRKMRGRWLTASLHQLLFVVVVVVVFAVVVVISVVDSSTGASVAEKSSSQRMAFVGAGVTTRASTASHPSRTAKMHGSLTTGLTHMEYRFPGSCL